MNTFHLANINFEWELKTRSTAPLQKGFEVHPNFLQLQFLPLLYGEEGDHILVTHLPPKSFQVALPLHLLSEKIGEIGKIETWGWSESAKKWADDHQMHYHPPPFSNLREIASKAFSFANTPTLPGAQLLRTTDELEKWVKKTPYPKIIKTCFGLSGRERFLIKTPKEFEILRNQIGKAFKDGSPLIGEPWVKRFFDFSSQWLISKTKAPSYLGATVMRNTQTGQYKETLSGNEEILFGPFYCFLKEHLEAVKIPIQKIVNQGYFGYLGIDAMVYQHPIKMDQRLHPIVEINMRKTFGYLALKLIEKWKAPFLSLSYLSRKGSGLLPQELSLSDKKKISFRKQLKADIFETWKH